MVNVLYISDSLKQRFGVTSVILNYISHMSLEKVHIDLLVYDDSEKDVVDKLKTFGCNVFFMPKLSIFSIFTFKNFIKDFFSKKKYDIVHSHFNQIDNIVFPIAKKNGTKICVSHSHNTKLSDNKIKAIRNKIMCLGLIKKANICAACSEAAGVALYGKKFSASRKKMLIKNGVDVGKYAFNTNVRNSVRKEFDIDGDAILIGSIGSFKPQKNHSFLISIFYELKKINPNYKLLLIGDGECRNDIQSKVEDLGLSGEVIFAGVRNDANKILNAIDLLIMPSFYEGLPVVGIEAQTNGLKCFLSDSITREVDLTGIIFLSLSKTAKEWATMINEEYPFVRKEDSLNDVINNGYDIVDGAKKLEEKYIELLGD